MSEQTTTDYPEPEPRNPLVDYLTNAMIVSVIRLALALPYETRVRFVGWLVERVIGPVAGYRRRALRSLQMIWRWSVLSTHPSAVSAHRLCKRFMRMGAAKVSACMMRLWT